jgi:hypothetical protein
MTAGLSLTKLKFTSHKHTALPYCQVVGSLRNLSQAMWPDIAFAVANLNKFVNSYDETHWTAIKHVIWYLKATRLLSIIYSCTAIHNPHLLSPTGTFSFFFFFFSSNHSVQGRKPRSTRQLLNRPMHQSRRRGRSQNAC